MSDFQLALRIFGGMFLICAVLAVAVLAIDAWLHVPLADFLVRRFGDIMLSSVTGIGGFIAGQGIERRKRRQRR